MANAPAAAGAFPWILPQTTYGRFLVGCMGGAAILCPLFTPAIAPFLAASFTGVTVQGLAATTGAQGLLTLTGGIWAVTERPGRI